MILWKEVRGHFHLIPPDALLIKATCMMDTDETKNDGQKDWGDLHYELLS